MRVVLARGHSRQYERRKKASDFKLHFLLCYATGFFCLQFTLPQQKCEEPHLETHRLKTPHDIKKYL